METIHKYLSKQLKGVGIGVCLLSLMNLCWGLFEAQAIAKIIAYATSGALEQVINFGMLLIGVLFVYKLLYMIGSILNQKYTDKQKQKCRLWLYKRIFQLPLHRLYQTKSGELLERLTNDFDTLVARYIQLYPSCIMSILTIGVYGIYFIKINPTVMVILVLMGIVQIIPPMLSKHYLDKFYLDNRALEEEETHWLISGYEGLKEIKLFDLKKWYIHQVEKINKRLIKLGTKSELVCQIETALEATIEMLLKYGTCMIMGFLVLKGSVGFDEGIIIIKLSTEFYGAINKLFSTIPEFKVAQAASNRLREWGEVYPATLPKQELEEIKIQDFSFEYADKCVFEHVTYTMDSRKIILLKGDNGTGKSTLIKSLSGLIDIDTGISIEGVVPKNIHREYLEKQLFYLPQHDLRIHLTPNVLFKEVGETCFERCKENALDFGLAKEILDQSMDRLSGGEVKKVFLALAFALPRKLLLLDEPTNALDQQGKAVLVQKIIERGKGIIMITHDSTLALEADEVLVCKERGILSA